MWELKGGIVGMMGEGIGYTIGYTGNIFGIKIKFLGINDNIIITVL